MDKKFLKHLEDQFGGYFVCSCSAPFQKDRFEIVKESESSLVAHYTCPRCNREHVLFYGLGAAVAAGVQTDMEAAEVKKFLSAPPISSDEVLAVRDYFKKFRGSFRTAFKMKETEEPGSSGSLFSFSS